ncbi:MMPL family transporter [Streptomyces triticirhizae]|uniref:MMPL family transporter n=1 Tax=Streptomyces triticirhizae TaxID=2483353 RepID=A0A3M2LV68_9ACTN|nr:MMPL family transporter [Streptomyces triticirhizae]RMI41122.1 MMPL family transporter [Streptomyces triticirhizae]
MLQWLARSTTTRPRLFLLLALLFVAASVVLGGGVAERLQNGGTTDPNAESTQAAELLDQKFTDGRPNLALLVTVRDGADVDDPAVASEGTRLADQLAQEDDVLGVNSYWATGSPALRSGDGQHALIVARIAGTEDEAGDTLERITPDYQGVHGPVEVAFGGATQIRYDVETQSQDDLLLAEIIALPLTLLVLVLVFRSAIAALLPICVALVTVMGTNAALRVVTGFTDVSIFALNLTTALGLGLAVDYGLFIVRRYREELNAGRPTQEAIRITMATAGRTVAFSALTVAVSLSALLTFPMYYLRSFAYAGIAVVLIAAAAALVMLPALMMVLGHRINSADLTRLFGGRRAAGRDGSATPGRRWAAVGRAVIRRPVGFVCAGIAVLVVMALPVFSVSFGNIDDRQLPDTLESRQVHDVIRETFDARPTGALEVLGDGVDAQAQLSEIDGYAARVSELEGVARVESAAGVHQEGRLVVEPGPANAAFVSQDGSATYLSVIPSVEDVSPESQQLVRDIRQLDSPFPVLVAGGAAELVDTQDSIADRLPGALAIILLATTVLLFLMTGSLVVPLKAIVLNFLSLGATFGAVVWVFQEGHLTGVVGDFTVTGFVAATLPVLMFCVAFGLTMDYEVFVLSRIKEEYDRTGDTSEAIVHGLRRSGGVVSAAAGVLAIVLVAIGTSQVVNLKMLGLGLALAVLLDAFLVRGLLMPAVMRLLGRANWWAPRPLKSLHARFGISEEGTPSTPAAAPGPLPERERTDVAG